MHLFLIRHGETEHNVAGLLAGITDSRLTNHGVLQTQRLGASLIKDRGLRFTNVFSSDLQRASMTANEICKAQHSAKGLDANIEVVKLEVLREQDFGSMELVSWSSRRVEENTDVGADPNFKAKETLESMKSRAEEFLRDHLVPLLALDQEESARIAVVSHGLFLAQLWRTLLTKFDSGSVTTSRDVDLGFPGQPLERIAWSNTGYLEIDIKYPQRSTSESVAKADKERVRDSSTTVYTGATMKIKSINDKRHLFSLKRARGGIGSAAHDQRQQNIGAFFKKRKLAPDASMPASKR